MVMFKILLLSGLSFISLSMAADDPDGLSRQFSGVTRGPSMVYLHPSDSTYALDSAGRTSPFADYVTHNSSDEEDDEEYERHVEAISKKLAFQKEKDREFCSDGLVSFILKELGLNRLDLNQSAGTVLDKINAVESLMNIHLKALNTDLDHVWVEKSELSYKKLTDPSDISNRYDAAIRMIRNVLNLGQGTEEELLNLAFSFFAMNVARLFSDKCSVKSSDTQSDWQRKYDIFYRNIKSIHNVFSCLSMSEQKNNDVKRSIEKITEPHLIKFYYSTCDFFAEWYKTKRSTLSQGLEFIGAKDSNTKKMFDSFDASYRTIFAFIFENYQIKTDLDDRKKKLLATFDETEKGFMDNITSVTNYLPWRTTVSTAAEDLPSTSTSLKAPQPTKASSGWGGWW